MINHEKELKVQAHLDQELSSGEAKQVAQWLEADPAAKAVRAELEAVRRLMRVGEVEVKLPESREFYWSKIERAIQSQTTQAARTANRAPRPWWWRVLAPAMGGLALLAAVLSLVRSSSTGSSLAYLHEIETPLEDTSAISFHSQSAGMTVVWVQSPSN